jgi:aryl-alcohol dehydrogenase-like predicted oxidoreductase
LRVGPVSGQQLSGPALASSHSPSYKGEGRFDDQLAAMVKARDDGLVAGVGLSNITRDHLLRALTVTDVACVQNPMNLADQASMPVLEECHARGIAFVPFFPLGSAFASGNPILGDQRVISASPGYPLNPAGEQVNPGMQEIFLLSLDWAISCWTCPGSDTRCRR